MASELLNCSICPKKPIFSDISHLLTHISSKGHLAHLHKLQVRTHQEPAAGIQLYAYNQWYQQHGLGQLLSERMLQKESKIATRRSAAAKKNQIVKEESTGPYQPFSNLSPQPAELTVKPLPKKRSKKANSVQYGKFDDNDSDSFDGSPIKSRRKNRSSKAFTPSARSSTTTFPPIQQGDYIYGRSMAPTSPEHSKLKGIIWPGMDMFDAAPEEMKRKRNQRKDGSVLKHMERLSSMVIPAEVVYSPGGTWRKQRHIDELEDDNSPIEGESPPVRKASRRKNRPLTSRSVNIPRPMRHPSKQPEVKTEEWYMENPNPRTSTYVSRSSVEVPPNLKSRYTPDVNDDSGFRFTSGHPTQRKRLNDFNVFNDGTGEYQPYITAESAQVELPRLIQTHLSSSRADVPIEGSNWMSRSYAQPLHCNEPYNVPRSDHGAFPGFHDLEPGKENSYPVIGQSTSFERENPNPLLWADYQGVPLTSQFPFDCLINLSSDGNRNQESSGYGRNPLAGALDQFQDERVEFQRLQKSDSPNGNLSDRTIEHAPSGDSTDTEHKR